MAGRVGLIAVNRGSEYWDTVIEYENTLQRLEPDKQTIENWEEANKEKIKNLIVQYETKWKNEEQWPELRPEDGR